MSNTSIWDQLGRTDPSHTKSFTRGGGFRGTAIKPMFSYRRMTETFGPCGIGWGVSEPSFQVVPGCDGEVLVYCTASIWYVEGETASKTVFGVGGDKVVGKNKNGLNSDDEAFKKAFTDAVTNALKLIGVGADVHMGMFDDSKYVNSMRDEFSDAPAKVVDMATKRTSSAELKRNDEWAQFENDLYSCTTVAQINGLYKAIKPRWTPQWLEQATEACAKHKAHLLAQEADEDVFPGDLPSQRFVSTLEAG